MSKTKIKNKKLILSSTLLISLAITSFGRVNAVEKAIDNNSTDNFSINNNIKAPLNLDGSELKVRTGVQSPHVVTEDMCDAEKTLVSGEALDIGEINNTVFMKYLPSDKAEANTAAGILEIYGKGKMSRDKLIFSGSSSVNKIYDFKINFNNPNVIIRINKSETELKDVQFPDSCDDLFYNKNQNKMLMDFGEIDTSNVVSMMNMFNRCVSANPNVSNWDTSRVMYMDQMFRFAIKANPDVSKWNTSNVGGYTPNGNYTDWINNESGINDLAGEQTGWGYNMMFAYTSIRQLDITQFKNLNKHLALWYSGERGFYSNVLPGMESLAINGEFLNLGNKYKLESKYGNEYGFEKPEAYDLYRIDDYTAWSTNHKNGKSAITRFKVDGSGCIPAETISSLGKTSTDLYEITPMATTVNVTFDCAGGEFSYSDEADKTKSIVEINAGETVFMPESPVREGFVFEGWKLNLSDETYFDFNQAISEDITLKAVWGVNVSFDSNGGSDVNGIVVNEGGLVEQPADPTRTGYTFEGWTVNGEAFDFSKPVTEEITLVASWSPIVYTISYELNGGVNSDNNPSTYTIESSDIILVNPTREGYIFDKWVDENGETVTKIESGSINNRVLKATWKVKVDFDSNGGSNIDEIIIKEGGLVEQPADPTRTGYTFEGWTVNGEAFDFSKPVTEETTLVASWSPIVYTISYELNGGVNSDNNPLTYTIESSDIILANPTKDGYIFDKWVDENGETVTTIESGSINNKNLEAIWEVKIYFDANGGNDISHEKVVENTLLPRPENPTRPGYIFEGWKLDGKFFDFKLPILSNIILVADWTPVIYSINYDLGKNAVNSKANPSMYTIESHDIRLSEPTREGYKFKGCGLMRTEKQLLLLRKAL